jgi:hypothetical protein
MKKPGPMKAIVEDLGSEPAKKKSGSDVLNTNEGGESFAKKQSGRRLGSVCDR